MCFQEADARAEAAREREARVEKRYVNETEWE